MNNKIIFLSGPISGLEYEEAKKCFSEAENMARSEGYTNVFNPMTDQRNVWFYNEFLRGHIYEEEMWVLCMKNCIAQLTQADEVWMLDGWQKSEGATIENHLARALRIDIRYL